MRARFQPPLVSRRRAQRRGARSGNPSGRARHPRRRSLPSRRRATGRGRTRSSIPTPTSSRSITASAATSSATRRSSGCTPARSGPKARPGTASGRYLVWSDIPNNVQMRWIEDDGRVTVFRNPSGYSNGNTFDYEGRQLSCEHGGRRVVRYEPNGTVTVIAEKFQGKRLNSPNDVVVHPDGGIWFTDPTYGIRGNYEGFKGESEAEGGGLPRGRRRPGRSTRSPTKSVRPNGICFSPDYKKLYVADTGDAARHQGLGRRRQDAPQRQAFRAARHSRHRRAVGGRRHPLRCRTATSGRARGRACR